MSKEAPRAEDTIQDLAHGQIVIVTARWILVLAGLLLTLWNPGPIGQMRVQILVIILLAFANFYLHAEILRQKPTVRTVAYLASAGDLFVITLIVISQGGIDSITYAFYFPAILGFSVAFPTVVTFLLTGATLGTYFLISVASLTLAGLTLVSAVETTDVLVIVSRLVMFAAVAFCGNLYRRIEHARRREAVEAPEKSRERIRERDAQA